MEKNKSRFTHEVLMNIGREFSNFRRCMGRSMNNEELKIFDDYMLGLEYRTKDEKSVYSGNLIHELVELGKEPEDRADIIKLLENKFGLNEYYLPFVADEDEKNNFGGSIGNLIRYKKKNLE